MMKLVCPVLERKESVNYTLQITFYEFLCKSRPTLILSTAEALQIKELGDRLTVYKAAFDTFRKNCSVHRALCILASYIFTSKKGAVL